VLRWGGLLQWQLSTTHEQSKLLAQRYTAWYKKITEPYVRVPFWAYLFNDVLLLTTLQSNSEVRVLWVWVWVRLWVWLRLWLSLCMSVCVCVCVCVFFCCGFTIRYAFIVRDGWCVIGSPAFASSPDAHSFLCVRMC
jgi:hypothetical protein